ncbi:hypothetical protein ACHWQZ_G014635 [Mnemiopsis leidyi]
MPYVTEQLKFNLEGVNAENNNKPTTRQPSPMLFNGIENRHDYTNTMEKAMLLAKRDIRLGNFPKDDDLDHIPVKEVKVKKILNPPKLAFSNSAKKHGYQGVHDTHSPGRSISHDFNARFSGSRKSQVDNAEKSMSLKVNIPSVESDSPSSKCIKSISMMIDNLGHAYTDLGRPISKQGYPDPIVEVRLQRRVEEQRRHLCRLLYNTKRHVSQMVDQLKRTAFNHRTIVLTQSNIFSHMNSAYRSLMSALNSFIRVSRTLHSTYMTDLVKKIRGDLKLLLAEFKQICVLLDMQISTVTSPVSSSVRGGLTNGIMLSPVGKLNITDKVHQIPGAPLSPDRNDSLKAAIKSLLVNKMSKMDLSAKEISLPSSTTQKKNLVINKKAPSSKPSSSKVIKPKSKGNISRYNTDYKRAMSAGVTRGQRPLGKPSNSSTRPSSATPKLKTDTLEIRGKVTPLITERELARQAWIDELGKGGPSFPDPNDTHSIENSLSIDKTIDKIKELKPISIEIPHAEANFKSKEMSATMTQLLNQLEEIQKEDEDIRSRWLHMQYSNPLNIKEDGSPIFLPSADLVSSNYPLSLQGSCLKTGLANLKLPGQKVRQIESYREAMLQYLRLTKHFKIRGFDPWATINNIVDNIVVDLVEDVCDEIINSCDGIADNVYLSEFLPA